MIIKQLQLGADKVFCYILACEKTHEAIIIDPCGDEQEILDFIQKLHSASIQCNFSFCSTIFTSHFLKRDRLKNGSVQII